MAPTSPRLKILSVGGNAVSAFLSWRLQATNACDVTLVWKNGFESVSQYGISFKSELFGNERFKPRYVVRSPEEAGQTAQGMFDYVVLCVKALPDVYDMGAIIESVVTPQHTCILINTSHAIGVESLIEQRFPKNVVLSLVSSAEVAQLGSSEFEHHGSTNMWVGPANQNSDIPVSIQSDMAEALAMTLASGSVECKVSKNIQQQQFERMVGPIAFHPASVLFETPTHSALLDLKSVRPMIIDVIDELKRVAEAGGCIFPSNFRDKVMEDMIVATDSPSTMYQDYTAKRPMEVETYLGGPLRIAQNRKIPVPRLETLYAFLHHINIINQQRPAPQPAPVNGNHSAANGGPQPPMRLSSAPPPRQSMNGYGPQPNGRGPRAPSMAGPPPGMRSRGPPPNGMNGTNGMNGINAMNGGMPPPRGPPGHMKRRPSFDDSLDEFGYLSMYGEDSVPGLVDGPAGPGPAPAELALRERELALRERELAMKERGMGGGPRMSRGPRRPQTVDAFDDDDDEGDYFDAMAYRGPPVNPDNVDMMSITSRRNRKAPTNMGQYRSNPEMGGMPRRGNPFSRGPRNRQSSGLMNEVGNLRDNVMENPMLAYSSDRYGGVDRSNLGRESRTNSLTSVRLSEMQQQAPYGGYPQPPINRRTSQSPGNPFGPSNMGNGYPPMSPGGRPPPPDMRQPVPRHPPGHGNTVAPQQVEQRAGVSNLYPPPKGNAMRSLTGSASASAGSGDSGRSAHVDSENSAYSSQSSLGPRPQIGVR